MMQILEFLEMLAIVKNIQAEAAFKVLEAEEKAATAILAAGKTIDETTQRRIDSARIAAETAGIEAAAAGFWFRS